MCGLHLVLRQCDEEQRLLLTPDWLMKKKTWGEKLAWLPVWIPPQSGGLLLCSAWRLFEFSSTNELVIFNFSLSNLPRRSSFADAGPAVSPYVWILVFITAPTWISGNNSPSSLDQWALLFPAPTPPHWQPITFQLPLMIILCCNNNCHSEIQFCLFFLSWCFCAPVNDHGPETSEEEEEGWASSTGRFKISQLIIKLYACESYILRLPLTDCFVVPAWSSVEKWHSVLTVYSLVYYLLHFQW